MCEVAFEKVHDDKCRRGDDEAWRGDRGHIVCYRLGDEGCDGREGRRGDECVDGPGADVLNAGRIDDKFA